MYIVAPGDTLQSIAKGAYGDSTLWYRIAEANGLSGDNDLKVGQSLAIPNRVASLSNNANSFRPYDPSQIVGDTTPNLPTPPPPSNDSGCGGLGQILVLVVVIAATVYSAGALAASGAFGTSAAATAAATSGAAVTSAAGASVVGATMAAGSAVLGGAAGLGAAVAAGAIGSAIGSIAGQSVGIAIGAQQDFNWSGVAMAALSGGVAGSLSGVAALGGQGTLGNTIVRSAVGNAVTQGLGVITGLQDQFDWRGVAASAVGAGVGQAVGGALANDRVNPFVAATATGLASGTAAAIARGGRISVQQVATDAFGNALGNSLKDAFGQSAGSATGQQEDRLGDFISQNESSWGNRAAAYDQIAEAFGGAGGNQYAGTDVADLKLGRGGVYESGSYVDAAGNRVQILTDSPSQPSIDALFKQAQGLASDLTGTSGSGQAQGARSASWLARQAQATTSLYASGAGDIRETLAPINTDTDRWYPSGPLPQDGGTVVGQRMTQAEMDAFDRLNSTAAYTARPYDSISPIGDMESILTSNATGRAIKGTGMAAFEAWTALPNMLRGVGTLAGDAMGYAGSAISPQRSVLTGQPFEYQPKSALLQSIQQQGVLGTLGSGITGAVRSAPGIGLIGALGAPNRDWGNVGAQVFNTGMVGVGVTAGMRGTSVVDFSSGETFAPGFYRADPRQLRFSQSDASPNFVDRTTGKAIGTIDSLVSDLRAGRVNADQVGSPLQVVMYDRKPFSIDNRRLVAFNSAQLSDVPIQVMSLKDPGVAKRFFDRFDPIRGEGLNIAITPASGRTAAQILMRDQGVINGVQLRK